MNRHCWNHTIEYCYIVESRVRSSTSFDLVDSLELIG